MGKIIYELQNVIGIAVNDYWKLKAIDSLRLQDQLPENQVGQTDRHIGRKSGFT